MMHAPARLRAALRATLSLASPAACASLLALAGLAGCASQAPAVRYYVLTPQAAAAAPAQAADLAVVVATVRLPPYLERPQIVTRSAERRLQLAEFDHWGGNLRQDLTRVLAHNLARLLASGRVIAAPHTLAPQADFRLEIELARFERGADGRVQLAAQWWLKRLSDGATLASPPVELQGERLPAEGSFDATVASMSQVYAELAGRIAQTIRRHAAAARS